MCSRCTILGLQILRTFQVSFENGTKRIDPNDAEHEIGTRMLFQLIGEDKSYGVFSETSRMLPDGVLDKLAEGEKINKKDMTVLILVDGIHALSHTNGMTQTMMKQGIDSVVALVNAGPYFCIGVFAATFYTPLEQTLAASPQKRISLMLSAIDGHVIIPSNNPLVRLLVDDMGGHGRALEKLKETLYEMDINVCSASAFMNQVKSKMEIISSFDNK